MEILQCVKARGRRWRVADVRSYESCQLVTLLPATSPAVPVPTRLLTPFDDLVPIEKPNKPRRVSRRLWRRACRALIARNVPPGSLLAAPRVRFDPLAYQLQPALAVLHGLATRVLLADEVGLGKTIQASLIFGELMARGRAERVLVLVPAGLRDQWAAELTQRFGIEATIASAQTLRQLARTLPLDVNPWETTPVAVASIDYVKRPEVLPAVAACRWDVLVVDEAHAVVGDSERHQAVRLLGARASYVLLLTATPHSGDANAFEALHEIGASRPDDRLLVFRRSRLDVLDGPGRRTHTLPVRASDAERRMFGALARFRDAVRHEQPNQALALSVLDKRAFSSAWALAESVDRRLRQLDPPVADANDRQQLHLPFDPDGERSAEDEPPEWPASLALSDTSVERRLLTRIAQAAQIASEAESKIRALARLVRRTSEPVLVFTEYRDTAMHLSRRLGGVPVLHGGLDRHQRRSVIESFTHGVDRVLVATDAGGQGLNLHHRCRLVVNLELPWNPVRLEQRVGRVDRIGQSRRVHAINLVARDTGELEILSRLEQRMTTARASMADASADAAISDEASGAEAEAARLAATRQLCAPGDEVALNAIEYDGAWTMRARAKTRRWLAGRRLHIYRVRLINGIGGFAGAHLLAVTLPPVEGETAEHPALVDAVAAWRNAVAAVDSRFWRARIEREEWIAAASAAEPPAAYQPGLFDRRAEHRRAADRATRDAFRDLAHARLSTVRLQSRSDAHEVALLLALEP
jgi:superfamily II DNA or RNA helicase